MAKRRFIMSEKRYKGKTIPYKDYKGLRELLWWIEDNIFGFKDDEGFNRTEAKLLSLRIQGLIKGFKDGITVNKDLQHKFTIEEITNTFKFVILDVRIAFEKKNFVNVEHKINYLMKAVESNINEMKRRMDIVKAKKEVEK